MNKAPKFGKVDLLIKSKKDTYSTSLISFEDCGLMITGDYIIVIIDENNEIEHTLTSTGKIYHLSEIASYKTHAI